MVKSKSKLIVGMGLEIDCAVSDWKLVLPNCYLVTHKLDGRELAARDFSTLAKYKSTEMTAFVAMNDYGINYNRKWLFDYLKATGFDMPPLIHPQSRVDATASIGDSAWIWQGAQVGCHTRIGRAAYMAAGSAVYGYSQIGAFCTLYENAHAAPACKLQDFVSIGQNVMLQQGTEVGVCSRLIKPGIYQGAYKENTFIENEFEAEILS